MEQPRQRGLAAERLEGRNVKIIGLGGIGATVAHAFAQFLSTVRPSCSLWLIDGDSYEDANRARVFFQSCENKALVKASELTSYLDGAVTILPVPKYVTPWTVHRIVEEGDIVLLCVDNHATRRCVSRRCQRLSEVVLISGGNDGIEKGRSGTFGNVMVYLRSGGRNETNSLTRFHPEIARPDDKRPDEMSCAELAQTTAPQLLFTNLAVASAMLGTFYGWLTGSLNYEELFLDITDGKMTPIKRTPRSNKKRLNATRNRWPEQ